MAAARTNLRRHQATPRGSPAGEPPEYETGGLHDSVQKGRLRRNKRSVTQAYGSEHVAAGLHEFGGSITQNGKRRLYPARPYIRPAEEQTHDDVERILEDL